MVLLYNMCSQVVQKEHCKACLPSERFKNCLGLDILESVNVCIMYCLAI